MITSDFKSRPVFFNILCDDKLWQQPLGPMQIAEISVQEGFTLDWYPSWT